MEPANQLQHIIGQVYLRQFEFKFEGKSFICTWKKKENFTLLRSVKSFNRINNYFDLPTIEGIDFRTFEKINGVLETEYPKIIKEIEEKKTLSLNNAALVKQFVANILCRTNFLRDRIGGYYIDPITKEKFLTEISGFVSEPAKVVIRNVDNVSPADQLNYLMLFVMRHISIILMQFNYVILEDYDEHGWVTGDNPVILEENEAYGAIMSMEVELYFPLSKKYCLYLYDKDSKKKTNTLKNNPDGTVIQASERIHKMVLHKMAANAKEYVIFPWNLGKTDLSKIVEETKEKKAFIIFRMWRIFIHKLKYLFIH